MIDIYLLNAIVLVFSLFLYSCNTFNLKLSNSLEINLSHALFGLFWFLLLSLEYGFRGNFTTDYENYRVWFNLAHAWNLDYVIKSENIEKGFLLLNYFVARFSSDYSIMTMTLGVLTVGSYFIAIKRNCEVLWPPIVVLIGSGIYYGGFNLSTQMLAGGVFAISVKYIFERKTIKYILMMLLAISIHKSAIILLPVYYISYINFSPKNRNIMIMIIIACAIFMTMFSKQLSIFASSFLYGNAYTGVSVSGQGWGYLVKNMAMTAIIIWFNDLFNMKNYKEKVIYLGSIFYCVMVVWSCQLALIQRFTYYFIIFPMLAFAHIIKEYKGNKAFLYSICVVFFTLMQFGWFGSTYYTYMYNL